MRIDFKSVRFQNFFSVGNNFIEVPLNQSKSTLIMGVNGAGKSTVLDAISYGLYGKPLRGVNKPQMVNSITGKNMLVEIEFSIGPRNYFIRRGMKPTIFEIFQDGVLLNQDSQNRDYQAMLESQILRLNHKSFCQIEVLSISSFTPFMKLPAAGRREIIEDLLDLQVFSFMNVLLKEKIAENKSAIQKNEYDIRLIEEKIDLHQRHVDEMISNNEDLVLKKRDQMAEYSSRNEELAAMAKSIQEELAVLSIQLDTQTRLAKEIDKNSGLLKQCHVRIKKLEKDIEFFEHNTTCPTCRQEIDDEFKTSEIASKKTIINDGYSAIDVIQESIKKLESEISAYRTLANDIRDRNDKIATVNTQIASNNQFIQTIISEINELQDRLNKSSQDDGASRVMVEELSLALQAKEEYIQQREVLTMAGGLLKDGGIKAKIIRQYIPILNKFIAKYLAALDFFVKFELDEQFKETIKSRFRDDFSYDSFSQGEKLRLDLALLFSFRAIAKLRNSASTNLLFFDEVLDSSLDQDGTDEFIRLIGTLEHCNVFVISHRDQIIDNFENVILFEKNQNFSKMTRMK